MTLVTACVWLLIDSFFRSKKLFAYQRRIGKRVLEKEGVNKIICCKRGLISTFELRKNVKKGTHTKSGLFSLRVDLINFDDNKRTML